MRLILPSFAVTSLLLLTPARTYACSCLSGPTTTLPDQGDTIAHNASIYVGVSSSFSQDDFSLMASDTGEELSFTQEVIQSGGEYSIWIHPDQPLPTTMDLVVNYQDYELVSFQVAEEDDTTAPTGGNVILDAEGDATAPGFVTSTCGPSVVARVQVAEANDDQQVMYELEVAQDRHFTKEKATLFSSDPYFLVGRGACSNNYPSAARLDSLWVRSRAVDLAGNQGPWSEGEKVRLPLLCAVADTPTTGLTWAALTVAGLGALRRRKGSQR